MTDGYDCYQNALAERVNGILKMEYRKARRYRAGKKEGQGVGENLQHGARTCL